MPLPATYWLLLTNATSIASGLSLTLSGGKKVTVVQGKVPKDEQELDSANLPLLYVTCSNRPVHSEWFATSDLPSNAPYKKNTYQVEFTMIAASNMDNTTGLQDYLDWRQVIVQNVAGAPPQIGVSTCMEVNYDQDPPVNRPAWMVNYDTSAINVSYECVEPAY